MEFMDLPRSVYGLINKGFLSSKPIGKGSAREIRQKWSDLGTPRKRYEVLGNGRSSWIGGSLWL